VAPTSWPTSSCCPFGYRSPTSHLPAGPHGLERREVGVGLAARSDREAGCLGDSSPKLRAHTNFPRRESRLNVSTSPLIASPNAQSKQLNSKPRRDLRRGCHSSHSRVLTPRHPRRESSREARTRSSTQQRRTCTPCALFLGASATQERKGYRGGSRHHRRARKAAQGRPEGRADSRQARHRQEGVDAPVGGRARVEEANEEG
jgi:hypothetical protein